MVWLRLGGGLGHGTLAVSQGQSITGIRGGTYSGSLSALRSWRSPLGDWSSAIPGGQSYLGNWSGTAKSVTIRTGMNMQRSAVAVGVAMLLVGSSWAQQTAPPPQTARQALIEMFFSKRSGSC